MKQRKGKLSLQGKVVSDKMNKTRVVLVERIMRHSRYGKYIKKYKKFYAHDEKNQAKIGDIVTIVECRPLSKLKRFFIASK